MEGSWGYHAFCVVGLTASQYVHRNTRDFTVTHPYTFPTNYLADKPVDWHHKRFWGSCFPSYEGKLFLKTLVLLDVTHSSADRLVTLFHHKPKDLWSKSLSLIQKHSGQLISPLKASSSAKRRKRHVAFSLWGSSAELSREGTKQCVTAALRRKPRS